MPESHLFLQRVLVSQPALPVHGEHAHLPMLEESGYRFTPLVSWVPQAGRVTAGWVWEASEGAEGTGRLSALSESCLPSMAPCSHHRHKAQSCLFQQESGRYLCHQPSVALGVALSVLPALLPRDMWKSGCLWSWGHRLPCRKVPKEGRQQHASAQIPSDWCPLPPQCAGAGGGAPSTLVSGLPCPLPPPAGTDAAL